MYMLQWCVAGNTHEAVTATSKAAWEIYWALKKASKDDYNQEDYWIRISFNGIPVNPEKGSALLICQPGEGPVFILKKGTPNERP